MIVCHRFRFIFLKTKKTAGTSVEIALSRFCGADDIITGISPDDGVLRRELGYRGEQNCALPWSRCRAGDVWRMCKRLRRPQFKNHSRASWIRERLPAEIWDGYHKFCVERNPWDRVISLYYWRTRKAAHRPPLGAWLRSVRPERLSNFPIYSIDGEVAVDRVLRFEDLEAGLGEVARDLELPHELALPRTKGTFRRDHRPARQVLDAEAREIIASACAREIELFGYKLDELNS